MAVDIAHTVLGGLLIATGGTLIGKILGNKTIIDRLDRFEKKLDKLVRIEVCNAKHEALKQLVDAHFKNLTTKVDRINSK